MADKGDPQLDLKKRARRRLVGSAALALIAAIVLPLVMDQEPRPVKNEVKIRVAGETPPAPATVAQASVPASVPAPSAPATPAVPTPAPRLNTAPSAPQAVAPVVPVTPNFSAKAAEKPAEKPADKPVKPQEKPKTDKANTEKPAAKEDYKRAEAMLNGTDPEVLKPAAPPAENKKPGPKAIQVGVYSDEEHVKRLRVKITELGYKTAVEKVHTAKGDKFRLKTGPFGDQAAAEKAQARLAKIGLNGNILGH